MTEYPMGPFDKLRAREFDDPDVRKILGSMGVPALIVELGQPSIVTRYAPTRGAWRQGDDRPALADDDPSVMQAIGRCAVSRAAIWGEGPSTKDRKWLRAVGGATHPEECGWCGYPTDELLAACDWATFRSRYVEAEFAVWHADPERLTGATYQRTLRQDVYENPAWAAFWSLPTADRQARIRAAQYPEAAA